MGKAIIRHHTPIAKLQNSMPLKLICLIEVADYLAYMYGYSNGMMDRIIEGGWDIDEWAENHSQPLDELHMGAEDLRNFKKEIFEQLHYEVWKTRGAL